MKYNHARTIGREPSCRTLDGGCGTTDSRASSWTPRQMSTPQSGYTHSIRPISAHAKERWHDADSVFLCKPLYCSLSAPHCGRDRHSSRAPIRRFRGSDRPLTGDAHCPEASRDVFKGIIHLFRLPCALPNTETTKTTKKKPISWVFEFLSIGTAGG